MFPGIVHLVSLREAHLVSPGGLAALASAPVLILNSSFLAYKSKIKSLGLVYGSLSYVLV